MLVLDTNHISIIGYGIPAGEELAARLRSAGEDVVTTVITLEEQMRGWLARIGATRDIYEQETAYERLRIRTEFMAGWTMLPWNRASADLFARFRREGIRIGTQDLRIAAITLAHDATLLSRNLRDFRLVPGLRVENWLD